MNKRSSSAAHLEEVRIKEQMLEQFEDFCRQPPNFYNLVRSTEEGKTYWALHTERAWQVWQAASLKAKENMA